MGSRSTLYHFPDIPEPCLINQISLTRPLQTPQGPTGLSPDLSPVIAQQRPVFFLVAPPFSLPTCLFLNRHKSQDLSSDTVPPKGLS